MAAKRRSPASDAEPDGAEASSDSEPEPPTLPDPKEATRVSNYEKQRLSRIAENKRRIEALGLRNLASSVMGSSRKARKGDAKGKKEGGRRAWVSSQHGLEIYYMCSNCKININKVSGKMHDSAGVSGTVSSGPFQNEAGVNLKGRVEKTQENPRMLKRRKTFTSRVKMTEDELIMHFFQFDEAGKGGISAHDLAKVADAHDFTWTDEELANMIHCFDRDGDGKLSLDDFSKIVHQCKMLQGSESS
ncbi:uncharacterized protein LOC120293450 [Eucalyptus grandis]|uniref:uncharacterized protein LOC120293450 n=1 Tax=Eucalyptus grandis TaxID=71139 RepID=UPI00192E9495|nr:uncharacterized protein LOC120293450 [Eucalyptus grandis]